ncbi:glycosyl hydrolase 2 galactose-binding domain-containing protein [Phocaeicola coprophilus]|uniref:beta-mannosidase n=2 Tax=Phocaeicola coprophilus TaxID=387090 RepID=UPI00374D7ABB
MLKKSIMTFLCGGTLSLMAIAGASAQSQTYVLDKGWEFSQAGSNEWMSARVPGTVHQDLLDHGRLPDPFYGMNEQKVQWVEKEDWLYRTVFTVTADQLKSDAAWLTFEGLDTYADVYLNGSLLLKADNMFVGHKLAVKDVLREGENRLMIRFRSPVEETAPQWDTDGFNYPADNDHSEKRMSVYTRKAPYSYGWDWGIRLATSGIWRPVKLTFCNGAAIDDFFVRQQEVTEQVAKVDNQLEINNVTTTPKEAQVKVVYAYGEQADTLTRTVVLQPGKNSLSMPAWIEKPHLWMPNGWGDPALYTFTATVSVDGKEVASREEAIGLRSIRVVMEDDKDGKSFYFEVNGKPMFAKGSNYIPGDALLPNMTGERYARLFEDIRAANMNMVRVWGGGIYEDDRFYEEADRNGILVWQDFIFACTTYPHDPTFLKRVSEEAVYNMRRLRNHASLAMWCGNNEIYEGMRYWGWKDKYSPVVWKEMTEGYDVLFRQLLPELVEANDPGRFYMHGSPYEANWGRPESWKIADSHNWGTWYGQKPFESLDTEIPRFMSEYGFQAFPEMKTIRMFASPEDYELESPVMNAHQKASIGNFLIKKTMALYYKVPEKFEDLIYAGLILQGQGMRHGIEAHRRHRPYCMGSLPWQLNDSWPVVSWSSIDYYGNWKAMHYQIRRAFAPVLVDAIKEGNNLSYYIMSDRLTDEELTLNLELMDFNGKVYRKQKVDGLLPANTSKLFYQEPVEQALAGRDSATTFMHMVVKSKKGEVLSDEIYYFAHPKDQLLPKTPLQWQVKQKKGYCEVTVKADKLARDIFIEVPVQGVRFSDNFFDLLPGQKKKVIITSPDGKSLDHLQVTVHQLSDVQ